MLRPTIQGVTLADLRHLKRAMQKQCPAVKSSHRVEALARGLGYNTYAALLSAAAAEEGTPATFIDAEAFTDYLLWRGFHLDAADLTAAIEAAQKERGQ